LGVRLCAQDGGVLLDFAFPPFFFRTADGAVSKGGSLWFPFFRPFFVKRQRKGIFAFTERAQLDGVEVGCARPKEKLLKV
jgi:hypothetical protein